MSGPGGILELPWVNKKSDRPEEHFLKEWKKCTKGDMGERNESERSTVGMGRRKERREGEGQVII